MTRDLDILGVVTQALYAPKPIEMDVPSQTTMSAPSAKLLVPSDQFSAVLSEESRKLYDKIIFQVELETRLKRTDIDFSSAWSIATRTTEKDSYEHYFRDVSSSTAEHVSISCSLDRCFTTF